MKRRDVARLAYGTLLVVDPDLAMSLGGVSDPENRWCSMARALGVRHVAQAVLCTMRPSAKLAKLSAAVDGVHAATEVAYALFVGRHRGAMMIDAGIATAFAVATVTTGRARPQ